jgi:DNA uptake protein ComE-like DNA-binding protein
MRFVGTVDECAEVVAELDAALGYPRGYTQADLDDGTIIRVGGGIHVPLELLRTETIAAPVLSGEEHVVDLPGLREEHRDRVARKRVLRVINRGSREALVALPGIGPARADALIARREQGRLTRLEDVRDVLPAAAVQALREHALTKAGDEDEAVAKAAAGKAKT